MVKAINVQDLWRDNVDLLTNASYPVDELVTLLTTLISHPLFNPSGNISFYEQQANCIEFVMALGLTPALVQTLTEHMLTTEPTATILVRVPVEEPPLLFQYFIAYGVFLNNCKVPSKDLIIGRLVDPNLVLEKALVIKSKYLAPDYQSAYKTCKKELNKQKSALSPELNTQITELLQQTTLAAKNENNQPMLALCLNATTRLLRRDISIEVYATIMKDIQVEFAYNPVSSQEADSTTTSVGSCCKIITDIMEAIVEAFVSAASAMTRRGKPSTFFSQEESKVAGAAIEGIATRITPKQK